MTQKVQNWAFSSLLTPIIVYNSIIFITFAVTYKQIIMDVAFILDKYFKGKGNVSIDVFDAQTLNTVYRDVVNAMTD